MNPYQVKTISKGEWKVYETGMMDVHHQIISDDKIHVADVLNNNEANAKLIATAPELLKQLKIMTEMYEHLNGSPTLHTTQAKSVIKKATI